MPKCCTCTCNVVHLYNRNLVEGVSHTPQSGRRHAQHDALPCPGDSRCEDMPKTTLNPRARAHGAAHGSRCGKRLSPHLRIPVISRTSHAMLGMPSTPPACKCSPRRQRDAGHALEKLHSASTLKLLLQWSCSRLPVKRAVLAQSRALRCCFERCSREAHEGRLVGDVGAGHHRSDSRAAVWAA